MNRLVVNFYGAPNSGKTVSATSLFAQLKKRSIDVVLVTEFAHEKVVEENHTALSNQLFIWASQQYKVFAGYRHAQVVVTDSPILLGSIYNQDASPSLHDVILTEHHKYNNLNLVMQLDDEYPYSMVGRIHSQEESKAIENRILELLSLHDIPFLSYKNTTEADLVEFIESAISENEDDSQEL
jgi:molybdopterin-guanine dinucleotide biosynthesis protein